MRPWDVVQEGRFPHFKYFVGGVGNPTVNLLDRHLARGADNRLALIREGEDGATRFFTYRMLFVEVCKCANVLKDLGIRGGRGRPHLYTESVGSHRRRPGLLPDWRALQCRVLRLLRPLVARPSRIVPAEGHRHRHEAVRRAKRVPLKTTVDEAIKDLPCVQTVIVVRRTGAPVAEIHEASACVRRAGDVRSLRLRDDR
jgi:acetyl-CoA synthetase